MSTGYRKVMFRDGQRIDLDSPSGGGSNNYNELLNTPIKNIAGSSPQNFVSLAGLEYGHYRLTGYYKEDVDNTLQTSSPIELVVTQDEKTGEKLVIYQTVYNHELKNNVLVYADGSLVDRIVSGTGDMYWSED